MPHCQNLPVIAALANLCHGLMAGCLLPGKSTPTQHIFHGFFNPPQTLGSDAALICLGPSPGGRATAGEVKALYQLLRYPPECTDLSVYDYF